MKRRHFLKQAVPAVSLIPVMGCASRSKNHRAKQVLPAGDIEKRALGTTGIDVSRLGFGSHLDWNKLGDQKNRDRLIRLGYEAGINLFDVYNREPYEQYIPMGNTVRDFRKDIVISLYGKPDPSQIQADFDNTLDVFHTDYIDLYRFYPINDESITIAEKNRQAGKLRAIGVASHEMEQLDHYLDRYGETLDYVLLVYNFHHNKAVPEKNAEPHDYTDFFARCDALKIGILAMKPMGSDNMIKLARERGYFKRDDVNITHAMLSYVFSEERIASALSAMNTFSELASNLEAVHDPVLRDHERERLKQLSVEASSTQGAYLPDYYKWLENWSVPGVGIHDIKQA